MRIEEEMKRYNLLKLDILHIKRLKILDYNNKLQH